MNSYTTGQRLISRKLGQILAIFKNLSKILDHVTMPATGFFSDFIPSKNM